VTQEILVAIHAGAGIIGLGVGLAVFSPPVTNRGRSRVWRMISGGLLLVLFASLLALIVTDWTGLETG
jgi:hypothetical protein